MRRDTSSSSISIEVLHDFLDGWNTGNPGCILVKRMYVKNTSRKKILSIKLEMIDNNCTYRLVLIYCDFKRFWAILGTAPLLLLKRSKGRRQRARFPAGSLYFRSIFSLKTINLRFLTSLDEVRIVVESFDVNSCEKTDQCHPEISRYVHKIRH